MIRPSQKVEAFARKKNPITPPFFGKNSNNMSGQIILWQVVSAYAFAVVGGTVSALLRLGHKPLCALISFAAGTLLGVTLFAILPESLSNNIRWAVALAAASG